MCIYAGYISSMLSSIYMQLLEQQQILLQSGITQAAYRHGTASACSVRLPLHMCADGALCLQVPEEAAAAVRKAAEPFLTWLDEAESEEESEEE